MIKNDELAINKICVLTTPEIFYDGKVKKKKKKNLKIIKKS